MASISSEILPEHREYERTAVTTVNAYLMPVISRYLKNLEQKLKGAKLRIMQSNEGYVLPSYAKREPIRTALSGPAGGVVASYHLGQLSGFKNLITFDMGGTSTDVSLIDGKIRRTNESQIGGFPLRLPIIDIHSVGAGGGSIAYVDKGGSLRVGPQSAGADPGPACYGKGMYPTVTDANLVLGRLSPDSFLGGRMTLHPERSIKALQRLAKKINKPLMETAQGIIDIANANMERAIRVISIERGFDPRNFSLFSFGGAGGMHAADIASQLKISRIIIPRFAGVLSALGLLLAESIKDYSMSLLKSENKTGDQDLRRLFSKLIQQARRDMLTEGFQEKNIQILSYLDLRYAGQSYEITVPYTGIETSRNTFHKIHRQTYSYCHEERDVEIVNLRIKAIGSEKRIKIPRHFPSGTDSDQARITSQSLNHKGKNYSAGIYDRTRLQPGHKIKGPAIIVDYESTTILPPGSTLRVDSYLNLIIQKDAIP